MPKGKKAVHDLYSPKIASKRRARREAAEKLSLARQKALREGKPDPSIPAKIDNNKVNKPLFSPHKIKKQQPEVVARKLSPQEGKQTVNAKPADALVHKPGANKTVMDPAAGAIEVTKNKKSKRRRRKKDVEREPKKDISQSTPESGL